MRVTSQHWEVLLQICEKHPNLLTGKLNGAQGKAEGNILWASVASKLNGLELGEKSVVEWRRAVTDWKSKVKAKACRLKESATQTGGSPLNTPPLTPLEETLINIMGKKGFEGDEGIKELGIPVGIPSQIIRSEPQNVLQEIEVFTEPSTCGFNSPDILKNKHKRDKEMTTDHQEDENQNNEHDYHCEENVMAKKTKRIKRKNITRILKNVEEMTLESVNILKNINKNTSRIADALEQVTEVLRLKQQQNAFE